MSGAPGASPMMVRSLRTVSSARGRRCRAAETGGPAAWRRASHGVGGHDGADRAGPEGRDEPLQLRRGEVRSDLDPEWRRNGLPQHVTQAARQGLGLAALRIVLRVGTGEVQRVPGGPIGAALERPGEGGASLPHLALRDPRVLHARADRQADPPGAAAAAAGEPRKAAAASAPGFRRPMRLCIVRRGVVAPDDPARVAEPRMARVRAELDSAQRARAAIASPARCCGRRARPRGPLPRPRNRRP